MKRRIIATLVAVLGISLLIAPASAGPAQAAAGKAIFTVAPPSTVYNNQDVNFTVDFPTGTYDEGTWGNYPYLAIWKSTDGTNFSQVAPGVKSTTSAGVLAMTYNVGTDNSWIKVCNDTAKPSGQAGTLYNDGTSQICTGVVPFDPQVPPPSGAVLQIASTGKGATATFTPAKSGQSASLQILTIVTTNTREVTSATWKTIATASQNSSGVASFSISNPYEVKHSYRAISGTSPQVVSNLIDFAAPVGAKSTGLPQLYFNTNEQAAVDTRTRYFEGDFSMTAGNGCAAVSTIPKSTMKGRGNYSWSFAKKSFTLKIDKATDLCGLGRDKKWAVVANHYDKSLLRNTVAMELGKKFTNLAWTPKTKPVDFWMNGSYRGSYILIERVSIDPGDPTKTNDTPRINIPELKSAGQRLSAGSLAGDPTHVNNQLPNITGGYVLEWDFRKGADYNITAGSRGYVGIKDPEKDLDEAGNVTDASITQQQLDYINKYVDDTDAALFGSNFTSSTSGWRKYIDEASAVDYYLAMEFMKPIDGNMWASVYMYKQRDGKLFFGPLWDFDMSSGSANRAGNAMSPSYWYLRNVLDISAKQSTKTWFNRLNEDASFRSKVAARWNQLYPNLSMSSFIDQQKSILSASAAENWKVWSHSERLSSSQVIKSSWSADVDYLKSWMSSRRSWLNGQY